MKEEYLQILAEKFNIKIEDIRKVVSSQFEMLKISIEEKKSIKLSYLGKFMFNEKQYASKLLNEAKRNKEKEEQC